MKVMGKPVALDSKVITVVTGYIHGGWEAPITMHLGECAHLVKEDYIFHGLVDQD